MFADAPFRAELHLSAVNSINWARIAAQVPYYVAAALALGAPDREVAFAVPTGNFGNILAAWVARRMGLPVARLVAGSNRNDILARFLAANDMSARAGRAEPVAQHGHPGQLQLRAPAVRAAGPRRRRHRRGDAPFREHRPHGVPDAAWHRARTLFHGFRLDDAGTTAEIAPPARHHRLPGRPAHRRRHRRRPRPSGRRTAMPMVAMATAHPAKFPEAIARATGQHPALPPALADLLARPERYVTLPNDLAAVEAQVRALARRNRP